MATTKTKTTKRPEAVSYHVRIMVSSSIGLDWSVAFPFGPRMQEDLSDALKPFVRLLIETEEGRKVLAEAGMPDAILAQIIAVSDEMKAKATKAAAKSKKPRPSHLRPV
jgi:hypothetical protein